MVIEEASYIIMTTTVAMMVIIVPSENWIHSTFMRKQSALSFYSMFQKVFKCG